MDEWLSVGYPRLLEEAEQHNAIIFFLDESTAKSEAHRGRTWGLKGLTPVVKTTGSRHRLNLISAVSSEGILRYRTFTGKLDRIAFVDFLKQLTNSVKQPVVVITDGHPAHRARAVKEYVDKEPRLLGVHLLPAYSPELNPDEQVWNVLKAQLAKVAIKTKEEFVRFIRGRMQSLQKKSRQIADFFRLSDTRYACRQSYVQLE